MTPPAKLTYTKAFGAVRTLGSMLRPAGLDSVRELPRDERKAAIVLHISCNAHFALFVSSIAQAVLRKLNKDFVFLGGPANCCGFTLHVRDTRCFAYVSTRTGDGW
jgi:hypothetical protein